MRLLLVTPCQLAIQDPVSGQSLIAVFHDIKIKIAENAPELPPNAIIPKEWSIFSKFTMEPDEEGKDYSLNTNIYWPNGEQFVSQAMDAAQPTKNGMAFIVKMEMFPIGQRSEEH